MKRHVTTWFWMKGFIHVPMPVCPHFDGSRRGTVASDSSEQISLKLLNWPTKQLGKNTKNALKHTRLTCHGESSLSTT